MIAYKPRTCEDRDGNSRRLSMSKSFAIGLGELQGQAGLVRDYPDSFVQLDSAAAWIERAGTTKQLAILARSNDPLLSRFAGNPQPYADGYVLKRCTLSHGNAAA